MLTIVSLVAGYCFLMLCVGRFCGLNTAADEALEKHFLENPHELVHWES